MADHLKNAIVAAFVVFIVATGVAHFFSATGMIGGMTAGMMAAMTFGTTLLTSVIGGMTSKGLNATAGNFGSKFAARGATAHRQLIYGKCRVGGTFVHMETTGVDNYMLHAVVVLAGHEIESLEGVRLNDVDLTTSSSTISGSTVFTVTNADFTNTENDNKFDSNGRLIRFTFQDGSQTAVDGYMDAQLNSMTTSDKFLDCAYVYIQMVFDPEKFGGGMPKMSFIVKGKKVYDPRTDSTAWSENPALCVRDYLSNTTYGLKALSSEINDTTNAGGIAAAANACEVDVTLADNSTTEDKYTANGFTNFGADGQGVLEGLLSSMAGKLSYTNGQFNVFAGTTQTPSLTITDDNLLASVNVTTNASTGELYNTVKPVFVDAANNYVATDAPAYQDSTFLTEDTPNGTANDKPNYVKQMEKQLPFTTTHTMAQRIGRLALKNQRQSTTISCLVDLSFMKLQPADWVYVTNERLSYSQKVFEVISINMEVMQSEEVPVLAVRLNLKETASSIYAFATSDYAAAIAQGSDLALGSYAMAAPSNLSVATDSTTVDAYNMTSVTISWTNSVSSIVTGTEVQYKKNAGSTYFTHSTAGKGVTSVNIAGGMEMGVQYNFRLRHVGAVGTFSTYTSVVNHTVGGTAVARNTITNSTVNYGSDGTGTLPANKGGTAITDFSDSTHKNENTTPANVGLSGGLVIPTVFRQDNAPTALAAGDLWVDTNDGNKLYRSTGTGTGNWTEVSITTAGIGLGNVPNVDMRDIGNVTSGTLAAGRGGTGLTSVSTLLNSNVDAEHVGLENVPNVDMRDIGNVTSGTLAVGRGGTGLTSISSLQNSAISYASILSASPSASVQWITSDGASYSPTGTTQDITVTFDGGTSTATCTVRWTYVNVSSSNNDYISACAFTGSSTGFTLGSITDLSGNNVKYATCVVTHTASSTTITLAALLSLLNVSGGGK